MFAAMCLPVVLNISLIKLILDDVRDRLLAKTILLLCGFKIYRQRFGDAGFWLITNKPLPREIHDEDVVFENRTAEPGQIKRAKLVCDGEEGRVKCRWVFDIHK